MVMRVQHMYPLRSIVDFEQNIDSLFDAFYSLPAAAGSGPRIDVAGYEDRTEVFAELPGVRKDDLVITVKDGVLTLKGKRNAPPIPEGATRVQGEIPAGEFARAFQLPHPVKLDGIAATLSDGILHVVLPKAEEARPKTVKIQ